MHLFSKRIAPPSLFGEGRGEVQKLLLIMRLTVILITVATLHVSAKGFTQQVTLSEKNAKLENLFKSIKEQTGYVFFYDHSIIEQARPVTIDVKDAPLETALNICFNEQPLTYSIIGTTIVVKQKQLPINLPQEGDKTTPLIDVHGRVVNEDGEPVIASVVVKGTKMGTSTNTNGEFSLKGINEDAVLVFSGVNIETVEVSVKGRIEIDLNAKTKVTNLNDVVINKGYYTEKQRVSTSDVVKITSKDIEKNPVSNVLAAIEGRVPGLSIMQKTGVAGGGFSIQLRGLNSIRNANNPFIVIDGVPFISQLPNVSGYSPLLNANLQDGSPLSYLNPNDIESIEILKDADATAIYGSRAANGAILITTKKAKPGRMRADVKFTTGFLSPTRTNKLLNTQQYLAIRHEAFTNDNKTPASTDYDVNGVWDSTRYTNWTDIFTNNLAYYNDAQLTLSGGSDNVQYVVGLGYNGQNTTMPAKIAHDGRDDKVSGHFSLNTISNNKKLKLNLQASYVSDKNTAQAETFSSYDYTFAPDAPPLYNSDGTLNWAPLTPGGAGTWLNPFRLLNQKYVQKGSNLVTNASITYNLLPGWEIMSNFGYATIHTDEVFAQPTSINDPANHVTTGNSTFNTGNNKTWIVEPQSNFNFKVFAGEISTSIATTFSQTSSDVVMLNGSGYVSDALLQSPGGAATVVATSGGNQYKYKAISARINYNYHDKYVINFTGRRDGSSRFGPGKQYGNFGSVAGAWIFSQQTFIQKNLQFLSFGKLRLSYGTTGSDGIADYQYFNLYTPTSFSYGGGGGLFPSNLSNEDLAWETNRKLDLGVNLGFLKDRIAIEFNFYRNRSSDQLLPTPLPATTGFATIASNLPALVENKGWEAVINSVNVRAKNFTWSSSFNMTVQRNKLIDYPGLASSTNKNFFVIGQPISGQLLYKYAGINDTTGVYQFYTSTKQITYSPNSNTDRTYYVSTLPDFFGGLENSFSYKHFSLSFFLQFVKQVGKAFIFNLPGTETNLPASILGNYWQKPGDKVFYEKLSQDFSSQAGKAFSTALSSDFVYEDASFIRLRNLAISYQFTQGWIAKMHLNSCRVFFEAQNLFTITPYARGIDPETQGSNFPPLRNFAVGIKLSL